MRENIVTVPNGLCLARIASTPVLGYFVVSNQFGLALSLFAFAGLTDLLDGYIARKFPGQQSVFGSFLDPFADKFLVATLFATLTYVNLIPVALTALIIARDVVLVFSGCVIRYKSLPPPKTVSRFFDVTMATAQLSPTLISKINTGVQLAMVSAALGAPVFDYTSSPALQWLFYITATTTVMSA
ncbi:putative cardiolipin synthase (CMP-forming) [Halotydeus destructor]|nr:putative cardiolipin synthase (CMP-forming) [Halotydeus destructor]